MELENVHDTGIIFEPIHRVMFGVPQDALAWLQAKLAEQNGDCKLVACPDLAAAKAAAAKESGHALPFVNQGGAGYLLVPQPAAQLEVGTLQNALDVMRTAFPDCTIDYIHGEDVVLELGSKPGNMGFLLPPMDKSAFFRTVIFDGALPRKTFSMGEAHEKRYYLECRSIEG